MPHIRYDSESKRHIADARDINGGEKRFKTAEEAREAIRAWTHDDVDGKFVNASGAVPFETCIRSWLDVQEDRCRRDEIGAGELANRKTSAKHIRGLTFRSQPIGLVKVSELRTGPMTKQVLPQLQAGRAHKTALKILVHFKSIFADAVLSEFVGYNAASALRLPKCKNLDAVADISAIITKENIQAIIDAANPLYRLVISFAAYTGLRAGEQAALTWDQIDFGEGSDDGIIDVCRARKKGGAVGVTKTLAGTRMVPMVPELHTSLLEWRLAQPLEQRQNGLVFPTSTGSLPSTDNWRNRGLHTACDKAGVTRIRWHDLRHFFASVLIFDLNENEAVVTQMMGHKDISFTKRQYGKWLRNRKRDRGLSLKMSAAFKA